MKNFYLATLLTLFLSLAAAPAAQARDTLTIGISQFPATLNPMTDSMLAKTYVMAMTIRPFTAYDADWKPICLLCTELPSLEKGTAVVEKDSSGKEVIATTYTIQPGATWGDGVPVTTRDVMFTWEAGKHPQSGFTNAEMFSKDIANITVKDDKTFTLHFAKKFCEFQNIDDFVPLPAHLEKKIFDADPKSYASKTLYTTDPTNPGLYFGPYRITKIDPGVALTLEENLHWWGQKPHFRKIVVRAIENTAALSANLLSGDIDYIAGELGLTLDQGLSLEERLQKTKPGQFAVTPKPGLIYEHMDINLDNPVFADRRVRQALLLGMDRDSISRTLFAGHQPVALSMVNELDDVFTKDVTLYPYDPARAQALLDEAGWKKGADGLRANAKGEKLAVQMITTAGNKTRELVQQAIQSDWNKIGIAGTIKNEPARVFFSETTGKRKFSDTSMYAWMSSPRNVPRSTLHSKMIPAEANGWAGQNYSGFKNAETDRIIDDLETVCAPEPRQKLWTRLQQVYAEELPALPLFFRADPFIVPAWLKGLVPTGHQHPSTYWIENWSAAE